MVTTSPVPRSATTGDEVRCGMGHAREGRVPRRRFVARRLFRPADAEARGGYALKVKQAFCSHQHPRCERGNRDRKRPGFRSEASRQATHHHAQHHSAASEPEAASVGRAELLATGPTDDSGETSGREESPAADRSTAFRTGHCPRPFGRRPGPILLPLRHFGVCRAP
jgi:hypothetical protein